VPSKFTRKRSPTASTTGCAITCRTRFRAA
jgi:hypothetical protein